MNNVLKKKTKRLVHWLQQTKSTTRQELDTIVEKARFAVKRLDDSLVIPWQTLKAELVLEPPVATLEDVKRRLEECEPWWQLCCSQFWFSSVVWYFHQNSSNVELQITAQKHSIHSPRCSKLRHQSLATLTWAVCC